MRHIKFRVWINQLDKFIFSGEQGWSILFGNEILAIDQNGVCYNVETSDIDQLVGFHSKDDNEIFEGDVIDNSDHNGLTPCGEPLSVQLTTCLCDKYRRSYFSGDLVKWK